MAYDNGPGAGGISPNLKGSDQADWVQMNNGKAPSTPKRDAIAQSVKRQGKGMR